MLFLQQLFQRDHQNHAAADAGQHTEDDPAFRHGDAGHRRDNQAAAKDQQSEPPQGKSRHEGYAQEDEKEILSTSPDENKEMETENTEENTEETK